MWGLFHALPHPGRTSLLSQAVLGTQKSPVDLAKSQSWSRAHILNFLASYQVMLMLLVPRPHFR